MDNFWELLDEILNGIRFVLVRFEVLLLKIEATYLRPRSFFLVLATRLASLSVPVAVRHLAGRLFRLICWLVASMCLRLYLSTFGPLNHSYGSLAGIIALLLWRYLSAAAILLGGELNAAIWQATGERS